MVWHTPHNLIVQFKLGEENNDDETNVQEGMKGMTPWKMYPAWIWPNNVENLNNNKRFDILKRFIVHTNIEDHHLLIISKDWDDQHGYQDK
jgi:hypothetical protein